jgi:hypothetical protein
MARLKLGLERNVAGIFRDYESASVMPGVEQAYNMYRANYRNMAAADPQVLISQRTCLSWIRGLFGRHIWSWTITRGFAIVPRRDRHELISVWLRATHQPQRKRPMGSRAVR